MTLHKNIIINKLNLVMLSNLKKIIFHPIQSQGVTQGRALLIEIVAYDVEVRHAV